MSDDTLFWTVCRDSFSYSVYRVVKETPKQIHGYRHDRRWGGRSIISHIPSGYIKARLKTQEEAFALHDAVMGIHTSLCAEKQALSDAADEKIAALFDAAKSETQEAR